jgi:hypothetical protein
MKHPFFLHNDVFYKTYRRFLVESFVLVSECIAADTVAVVGRLVAVAMFFVYIVVSVAAVAVVADAADAGDMRVAVAVVDRV